VFTPPRPDDPVGTPDVSARDRAVSPFYWTLAEFCEQEPVGVWEPGEGRIIVKRTQLQSLPPDALPKFAGTVLHELSHALSGAPDVSLEFEQQLTEELGGIVSRNVTNP
jgi:hypothetical protein